MPDVPQVDITQLPEGLPSGLVVLDVREDDEWQAGHIEGATHIPMGRIETELDDIPAGDQVLVVCRSGGRSARVTGFLTARGVDAVNFDGGMKAWEAAGRAMTSDTGAAPEVI